MKGHSKGLLTDRVYRKLLDTLYEGVYFVDRDRTIIYWNEAAKRMTGYNRKDVLGKHCGDGILRHVDDAGNTLCEARCLMQKAMDQGISFEGELFFHHREGHQVPVLVKASPIRNDRGKIVGAVETFSDNYSSIDLGRRIRELEHMALLDPLTKLGNRRYGEMNLVGKLREFKRYSWPFGVLFIDIDHFKDINDMYGHDAGDKVLKLVATTINNGLRSSDVVSRWGGEEFVAFVANVDEEKLRYVGEKIRALVERSSMPLKGSRTTNVTISIGATLARKRDSAVGLINRADALMYCSKKDGRNRVTM